MSPLELSLTLLVVVLGVGFWKIKRANKALHQKVNKTSNDHKRLYDEFTSVNKYATSLEIQIRDLQLAENDLKNRIQSLRDENEVLTRKLEVYLNQESLLLNELQLKSKDFCELKLSTGKLFESNYILKNQFELLIAKINKLTNENLNLVNLIAEKDELYRNAFEKNISGIYRISELIADHYTVQYELTERYLKNKPRPAVKQADELKKIRVELREYIIRYKQLKYTLELLKSSFPVLDDFIEGDTLIDDQSFLETQNNDDYDEVASWISKEDYERLEPIERNELALENYLLGKYKKTKWQIGRDYELFVGFTYEEAGYKVQYTGINDKFSDMGRDLICVNENEVLIIQCKFWSSQKTIRENAIAQLYGTTKMYELQRSFIPGIVHKIKPVLVTNISLSSNAKQFADYLGVQVIDNFKMGSFPSIKCNVRINADKTLSKIYHLPMDQMYDRVKIELEGECWVSTVRQAEQLGFRRARRFNHFNS